MNQYSLVFCNNSKNQGNVCIFLTDPNLEASNAISLAWFSKTVHPTTRVNFSWSMDFEFIWSETGIFNDGVKVTTSQRWPADLNSLNQVNFTYDQKNQSYTFTDLKKGPERGRLFITESRTLPLNEASVGIGLSGRPALVIPAYPNTNLVFTPHVKYWIAFGRHDEGEVVNVDAVTNKQEIQFQPGINSLSVILNDDNTWSIDNPYW